MSLLLVLPLVSIDWQTYESVKWKTFLRQRFPARAFHSIANKIALHSNGLICSESPQRTWKTEFHCHHWLLTLSRPVCLEFMTWPVVILTSEPVWFALCAMNMFKACGVALFPPKFPKLNSRERGQQTARLDVAPGGRPNLWFIAATSNCWVNLKTDAAATTMKLLHENESPMSESFSSSYPDLSPFAFEALQQTSVWPSPKPIRSSLSSLLRSRYESKL